VTVADEVLALYAQRGAQSYFGEDVNMSEHGLQAAHFAEADGAPEALVIAALLHDIGHLTENAPADIRDWKHDAHHERSGARYLAQRFGPEVSEPVRLHVPAKRYLCATDPDYLSKLSEASVITLKLQGGPMSAAEIAAFEAEPHWREAVRVRRWDDMGKVPRLEVAGFEHYRGTIERLARGGEAFAVRALLFDLDGTLINTERHTDAAVPAVMARYGHPGYTLPHTETHGRTWTHVAETLRARLGLAVPAAELAAALLEHWNAASTGVQPIPGAPQALRAAVAAGLRLAVVSSSPRSVIDRFLAGLGVADCVAPEARIGAESVRVGKPDPECFLLAARALKVAPSESLVFEDSVAGLEAARAAGMRSMFVTCCAVDVASNKRLATASFTDYRSLPAHFWAQLAAGAIDLRGRSYS
jgi:phosphonate degradation associated HDIG domain protein